MAAGGLLTEPSCQRLNEYFDLELRPEMSKLNSPGLALGDTSSHGGSKLAGSSRFG